MSNTDCPTCGRPLPVDESTFGGRLQLARVAAGLERRTVATALGYKRTTRVTAWESGSADPPSDLNTYLILSSLLVVKAGWLLFGPADSDGPGPVRLSSERVTDVDAAE